MRAAAVLVLVAACHREWVREYDGSVPGAHEESAAVFVVRDHLTGRPIPGAVVRQHPECELGEDGKWAPVVDERTTDALGIVTFPLSEDPGNCHWAVHAAGYASVEHYGKLAAAEIDLERGEERVGRLVGMDGAPLAGVMVEYKRGCAHAPALLETRTDADGLFLFPHAIDGDYVLEDPRFMADYWSGEQPRPRRLGVPSYRVWPGATLRGRVVGSDGAPPSRAVVLTSARGPRAPVGADGSFTLRGLPANVDLSVWWEGGLAEFERDTCRPGGPVTLYVEQAPPDAAPAEIRLLLCDGQGTPPRAATKVHFDRAADGRRFSFEWSPWGEVGARALVPPGSYVVSAGDPWSELFAEPRTVAVRGPCDVRLVVRPQPTLVFDRSALPKDVDVLCHVLLEDASWSIDNDLEHGSEVHLPATARAWLRVRIYQQFECDFPIGPERAGVRKAKVRLPGPKEVKVVGLDGSYDASLLDGDLVTHGVGTHWLVVDHEELGHAMQRIELPWAAATVEVRDFAFEPWTPGAELRVVDAQGRAVPDAEVRLLDEGDDFESCDEQGLLRDQRLRAGMHVRIDATGCLPLWTQLSGDPPWEIRLGGAAVEVDLADVEDAACLFDTVAWLRPDEDGRLMLRAVPAGPHTLVVGAPGRASVAYRLVLRDGETRQLRPQLR